MKKFLAKRWHSVPVGIVTAVLLLCLVAGSAFAAYSFFGGSAEVTVNEALTMSCLGGDGGWDGSEWTVSLYPGETKTLNLQFNNVSSAGITVDPVVVVTSAPSGWDGHFACDFASDTYLVPGSGICPANLQASADASAPPGSYICTVTISR